MRFAILTNAFPPDGRGGAERTAFMQADALACLGHDVRVWAPDKGAGSRGSHPGDEHAHVSLSGLSASLLLMDAVQGRVDNVTALARPTVPTRLPAR